jgi:hypothetical protein
MSRRLLPSLVVLACLVVGTRSAAPPRSDSGGIIMERVEGGKVVQVVGLDAANLKALREAKWDVERWSALLAIRLDRDKPTGDDGPAMLGSYSIKGDALRFEPRFPFAVGTRYRAVFNPARLPRPPADTKPLTMRFTDVLRKRTRTVVTQVYPTSDRLPENQLKFYIHFSEPMSRGDVYKHITLLDASGKPVQHPFLELDQELWNADATRFTLFFDPGRVKRGLKPREEVGPALIEGKKYTLVIDRNWHDADDVPLRESYRKSFSVGAPDDTQPNPKKWKLDAAPAGSTKPLTLRLEKPLDHALLYRMLWVTDAKGRKLAGTIIVSGGETRWQFTPREPWRAGAYSLVADTRLEDRAGNTIARPFEVDVLRPIPREVKQETIAIPFKVEASRR